MKHTSRHLSMDAPFNEEDDNSLLDVLPDEDNDSPDEEMLSESVKIDIERALSALHDREAEITRLYFGIGREHPLTLEEIGKRFDLTRERVRQIKEKALRKLRQRHSKQDLQPHTD
jgi:RNA polymerase primary sigma factor